MKEIDLGAERLRGHGEQLGEEHPPDQRGRSDRDRLEDRLGEAEDLAVELWREASAAVTRAERRRRRRVAALVEDEASRSFLLELTDQVLRIRTRRRAAARLARLVADYPAPAMAGAADRVALSLAARLANVVPGAVVALATARLRRELATLVLPAEPRPLARHLRRRRAQGMRLNVNLLGEAVLGERQAHERARLVTDLLRRPEVDCVSVKLSALDSQLDVLAYEHTLDRVRARMRPLLREACAHSPTKLVNLDMEEYRDLGLTVDAFTSLLEEEHFAGLTAGIALQAYLPDSADVLRRLADFARRRHRATGASVRVRLVKGANLAMERVEAELRGWPQAPYTTKAEVDANYKRLLEIALAPENAGALIVGVASHNLFDVAWALVADRLAGGDRVEIEMLEGMAIPEAEAVAHVAGSVLLYAPVVRRDDFESAVAYLVRRFDENTAPENYLAHLASLEPGTDAWEVQRQRFRAAVLDRERPGTSSRRQPTLSRAVRGDTGDHFANAPDTDWSVRANRSALADALDGLAQSPPDPVCAIVDGDVVEAPLSGVGIDPSHPAQPWYRYVEADVGTVERAVAVARRAAPAWAATPAEERRRVLRAVADVMESERARTIAVMVSDAGKVVREGDPEVSEAIDSARFYGDSAAELDRRHGPAARFSPHGVVVVAPPWNFPYAIPAGGTLAALAAGSAVILKPAPETVLTASVLAAQCHEAGVPAGVLQFLPCADDEAGRRLINHPDVDAVVLTGAWDTARLFLGWRPTLPLHAETSGKNAIVVTAAADPEDAVRDIVHSAFSHAGQKCSAASLAILEGPVHDDPRFLERLADAVSSLRVGPAADLATRVAPLIRPPTGPLARALSQLAPGERWLVEPRQIGDNPRLWSPGVKLGVAPQSEFHLTECFGPVLGVMRARDLDEAIDLQNSTPYGLTGGICTLDEGEIAHWEQRVAVGNAYVDRHITGAIVRRQPFGGWKRSAIGPGSKAGGPSYVSSLGRWRHEGAVDTTSEITTARTAAERLLAGEDASGLRSELNLFRRRPLRSVAVRIGGSIDRAAFDVALAVAASLGVDVRVSAAQPHPELPPSAVVEDDDAFVLRLRRDPVERVRLVDAEPALRLALLDAGFEVDTEPVVALGTYELERWTREQAISRTLHRHGNVIEPRNHGADAGAGARSRRL